MRIFKFSIRQAEKDFACEENGWVYRFKQYSKFCVASLKTPCLKEVSHSKGTAVRREKHTVFCVGLLKASKFYGIALFDLPLRPLLALGILCGTIYASEALLPGILWTGFFYILISILSVQDDERLMARIKRKFQG